MAKLTETQKNAEYSRGIHDAQKGVFNPPKGDALSDVIFSPIDMLTNSPSSQEEAEAKAGHYRAGHSFGLRLLHRGAPDSSQIERPRTERSPLSAVCPLQWLYSRRLNAGPRNAALLSKGKRLSL